MEPRKIFVVWISVLFYFTCLIFYFDKYRKGNVPLGFVPSSLPATISFIWLLESHKSFKNSFRNTIRVSNSLDPYQARHFVRPDWGPNCLQRLSPE